MLYFLAILTFFVGAIGMLFAKDSYVNRELDVYQRGLNEPWIHRFVAWYAYEA